MEWLSNEVIFYIGVIIIVCSFLASFVYIFIFRIRKRHLMEQLDKEYGTQTKIKK